MSECSETAYRGLLSSLPALSMALGIVVTYAFGSFLPWDDLAYFCSAFSVLLFSAMITMPRCVWLNKGSLTQWSIGIIIIQENE